MPETKVLGYRELSFNEVPLMEQCSSRKRSTSAKELLQELKTIFTNHNVQENYGIIIIHRHFDLNPEEILVQSASIDGKYSVLTPWTMEGPSMNSAQPSPEFSSTFTELNIPIHKYITPLTWKITGDADIIPFEYENTMMPPLNEPTPLFLKELYTFLKKSGQEGELGLRRIAHGRHHGVENTENGKRISITKYSADDSENLGKGEEGNPVDVVWDFSSKHSGGKPECNWCSTSCCSTY